MGVDGVQETLVHEAYHEAGFRMNPCSSTSLIQLLGRLGEKADDQEFPNKSIGIVRNLANLVGGFNHLEKY